MKTLLSLSVSGTLLLLLILGLKQFYKNKFSRCWQYYIWIIVALRFLLPLTPETTIVGSLFAKFDATVMARETPIDSDNAPVTINANNNESEQAAEDPDEKNVINVMSVVAHSPLNLYAILFFIWVAPVLVLFIRKITIYQGFIQYIKAGNTEISDIKILNLMSECEEKLNIKTRVELFHNSLITSPIMIGFFRPSIILPVGELGDQELSYIFMHELTHYRQKDMFYKWLVQIVVCVHWFNPFVYLLEKEVNKSCELSCDEKVISLLDDRARRAYGDTLISFLKSNNLYKNSLASVTLTEGTKQLKERLGAIMKFKKSSKTGIVITAIFTVAVCFCFLATGAYAAPETKSLTQEEKESVLKTAAETDGNSEHSASYKKLIAYKTDNYLLQSIADFHAALASTPDELSEFLQAMSDVAGTISPDDENYDFFKTTLSFSSGELYGEHMGEEFSFNTNISKQSRPSKYLDSDGEIWYDFYCSVELTLIYTINSPEILTVAERDNTLLTFQKEMQDYLNGLSEAEITDGNLKAMLTDKAAELANSLSTEYMKINSCDFYMIDISDL